MFSSTYKRDFNYYGNLRYRQRYPSLSTPTSIGVNLIYFLEEKKQGENTVILHIWNLFSCVSSCVVTCLLCNNENFGASLPKVLNVLGKWIAKTLYAVGGQGKRENKNSLTAQASYPTSPLPDISFSDSLTSGEFSFRVRV